MSTQKIQVIADIALESVELLKNLTQEEWDNLDTYDAEKTVEFYQIIPVDHTYDIALQEAIDACNNNLEPFERLCNLYFELSGNEPKKDCVEYEKNLFFDNWFDDIVNNITPTVLNLNKKKLSVSTLSEEQQDTFELLWGLTNSVHGLTPYFSLCNAYCIQIPILFPSRRKELARIGMMMTACFYLEKLNGRIQSILFPNQYHRDSDPMLLESCVKLIKLARSLTR
jgi:hypothetical protein